jgi:peptidoglycan/LPS O-acetylase OafA/YrhL
MREHHGRLVYVDGLRILAMAVVFLIHVCEVFNPWDTWHTARIAHTLGLILAAEFGLPLKGPAEPDTMASP